MSEIEADGRWREGDAPRRRRRVDSPRCMGCQNLVLDKYLFSLGDTFWHKACALCDTCKGSLEESCFMLSDNKLFCRSHYYKSSFATKCAGCHLPMQSHEVAMHALNRVYHVTCFACSCCKQLLQRGDEFILHGPDSLLVCRTDYESGAYLHCTTNATTDCGEQSFSLKEPNDQSLNEHQNSYQYKDDNQCKSISNPSNHGRQYNYFSSFNSKVSSSSKRPRTTLTFDQKRRLMVFFKTCQNPSYKQRESLAEEMKLPLKVVQVWFQNQRAKVRQIKKLSGQISSSHQIMNDDQSSVCHDPSVFRMSSAKKECGLDQNFSAETQSEIEYGYTCDQEKTHCPISQSTEDHDSPPEDLSDCQTYTPQDDTWHCLPKQESYHHEPLNFNHSKSGSDLSTKSLNYLTNISESWLSSSNSRLKYPS